MLHDDLTYAIAVTERRKDVVRAFMGAFVKIVNDERQGWPDIQRVPHMCFVGTSQSQIQATW
jgi:hypothetical protein